MVERNEAGTTIDCGESYVAKVNEESTVETLVQQLGVPVEMVGIYTKALHAALGQRAPEEIMDYLKFQIKQRVKLGLYKG